MLDLIAVLVITVLFVLALLYVEGCEHMKGKRS